MYKMPDNIAISVNATPAKAAAQLVADWAVAVESPRHISSIMKNLGDFLTGEFNRLVHLAYMAAPEVYHHVYEWAPYGQIHGSINVLDKVKLWTVNRSGSGRQRELSFTFLPSKVPGPQHPEAERRGIRTRIFVWKAPVMEAGKAVYIRPRGDVLAFYGTIKKRMFFYRADDPRLPLLSTHPGGIGVKGSFMRQWLLFSSGKAQTFTDERFLRGLDAKINAAFQRGMAGIAARQGRVTFRNPERISTKHFVNDILVTQLNHYRNVTDPVRRFADG